MRSVDRRRIMTEKVSDAAEKKIKALLADAGIIRGYLVSLQ